MVPVVRTGQKTNVFKPRRLKKQTCQRNRRERPVCRSGGVPDRTASGLNGVPHDTVQKLPPVGKLARPWARLMRLPRGSVKHCGNNRRIRRNVVPMSFRPQRQRSGGIFPSSINNLRKVKLATWEDPSTSFHFGRDDMSGGGAIQPHGLYSLRCMVVLRAANQNLLIAGGNHTLIPSMNHRRYIAYFHSTAQVVSGTWRAAGCRPYVKFVP